MGLVYERMQESKDAPRVSAKSGAMSRVVERDLGSVSRREAAAVKLSWMKSSVVFASEIAY